MKDDGFMKSINHASCWFKDDPFILATQATKVFYLDDTKHRGNWKVVQKFTHRHLWNVAENESEEQPNAVQLSYQDDECVGFHVQLNEGNLDNEHGGGENHLAVDATAVDDLRRQGEEGLQEEESSDGEDETIWQYASDCDEGPTVPYDEDDDYSDGN